MTTLQFKGSGYIFTTTGTLETLRCGECGIPFAMPEEMLDWARKHPEVTFYCPNGHARHFPGRTLEQKLKDARDALARERSSHDQTQASLKAQRAATTRIKNERDRLKTRTAHGVCPCCNRTFQQLARHMRTLHPDFAP